MITKYLIFLAHCYNTLESDLDLWDRLFTKDLLPDIANAIDFHALLLIVDPLWFNFASKKLKQHTSMNFQSLSFNPSDSEKTLVDKKQIEKEKIFFWEML